MRGPGADPQVVVGLDDAVEAGDVAEVDEERRLGEPELDQRDEAVAAGQELGLAFAVLQDPQRLVQVGRTDVVELAGIIARPSSSLTAAWLRPSTRTGTAVTVGPTTEPGRVRVRSEVRC